MGFDFHRMNMLVLRLAARRASGGRIAQQSSSGKRSATVDGEV
jgi:hypothetical protein